MRIFPRRSFGLSFFGVEDVGRFLFVDNGWEALLTVDGVFGSGVDVGVIDFFRLALVGVESKCSQKS